MPYDLGVWTEREGSDWEACVISSYLEGMIYGGWDKFPLGVYTQQEREALEKVADEPQDYNTTDVMALLRYGVSLRRLSVGTILAAVSRPGVGVVLAGYGGLLIPTTAPIHSVFWADGLAYDPLAPNQSAGQPCSIAKIVSWAAGAGPNQAREVRRNEFFVAPPAGDDVDVKGTNQRPIHNRSTTLKLGGKLVADCTAMPYTNLMDINAGTAFTPAWQVTGNEILGTKEWFGGFVFKEPGKAIFGYLSLGLFEDPPVLTPIEEAEGEGNGFTQGDIDAAVAEAVTSRDDEWTDSIITAVKPKEE